MPHAPVQVFVFCCSKAAAVKEYLEASKWNVVPDDDSDPEDLFSAAQVDTRGIRTGPDIRILTGSAVTSAGDALREIDSMGVIRSKQFILVSGDVISNMNLTVRGGRQAHTHTHAHGTPALWLCCQLLITALPPAPRSTRTAHVQHRRCWSSTRLAARPIRRR